MSGRSSLVIGPISSRARGGGSSVRTEWAAIRNKISGAPN